MSRILTIHGIHVKINKMRTLLIFLCTLNFVYAQSPNWQYSHIKGSNLVFKNNKSYNTRLSKMKFIEVLGSSSNPYFLVSGRSCSNCGENISIYLLGLADKAKSKDSIIRYQYPGKLRFYEDNSLLSNNRMIYGKCLKNSNNDFLIWIQNDKNDEGRMEKSLYLIEITEKGLVEKKVIFKDPNYVKIMNSLSKNYKELKGIELTSEP